MRNGRITRPGVRRRENWSAPGEDDQDSAESNLLAVLARSRPAWMKDGACRQHENSHIPKPGKRLGSAKLQQALDICDGCVVKAECLEHAIAVQEIGVWGGRVFVDPSELKGRGAPYATHR